MIVQRDLIIFSKYRLSRNKWNLLIRLPFITKTKYVKNVNIFCELI